MSLREYCDQLGWNIPELARQAGIDRKTAERAYNGETVSARTARDVARALSDALGRTVHVGDIKGLNIS